jgi:hypothetical protein
LYSQANAFHEPQTASVKHFGHEQVRAHHLLHDSLNFRLRHHRWRARMPFCLDGFEAIFNRLVQYVAVQKNDGIQCLPLC